MEIKFLGKDFGNELVSTLSSKDVVSINICSAWIRESGLNKIEHLLKQHLENSASVRIIAGIDMGHTSKEALEGLLLLSNNYSNFSAYIYHNRDPSETFHPKVYQIINNDCVITLVGSNNFTASGFYTNREASTFVKSDLGDEYTLSVSDYFDELIQLKDFTVKLDEALIKSMFNAKQVKDEKDVSFNKPASSDLNKIFGSKRVKAPVTKPKVITPSQNTLATTATGVYTGFVIRVRPSRGTQIQIPGTLLELCSNFIRPFTTAYSVHYKNSPSIHGVGYRNGTPNTIKFEMNEVRNMIDPVARFEWNVKNNRFEYTVFERNSKTGLAIEHYFDNPVGYRSKRAKEAINGTQPIIAMGTLVRDLNRATIFNLI
ncbi:MAG: NgoFVII family restriction endonuclease [Colwellia sp.]|nr:NgoFVII family restriction endonuclease [Colwellia sp.]